MLCNIYTYHGNTMVEPAIAHQPFIDSKFHLKRAFGNPSRCQHFDKLHVRMSGSRLPLSLWRRHYTFSDTGLTFTGEYC